MLNYLRRIKRKIVSLGSPKNQNRSYSQCGEDLIIRHLLAQMDIYHPAYIDIGAHHPTFLNNTYLFYRSGATGVNIEPDFELCQGIARHRKKDINQNVGVSFSAEEGVQDFYVMSTRTLNTFSREEAERIQGYGSIRIDAVRQVKTVPINNILEKYFSGKRIDLLSIDTEGLDHEILKTIDFEHFRPLVLCVETISYTEDKTEQKNDEMIDFLLSKGYIIYADTYINTIFVEAVSWKGR